MKNQVVLAWVFLSASICASAAIAQDGSAALVAQDTGAQDAVTATSAEGGTIAAPPTGRLERSIAWAQSRFADGDGFYPEFGGLITGSGMSVGPGFRHHLFGGSAVIDASAAVSWKRYTMMQSNVEWPRLINGHLSLGGQLKYEDLTQINYFGLGNGVVEADQTDYRLKNLDALGFAMVRPRPWLSVTGRLGILRSVGVERGTSSLFPSTGDVFDEISAPGLAAQPGYLHADVAVEADTRDVPGDPKSGGRYRLSMAAYHDRDLSLYSFRRIEAEAAQYVPVIGPTVLAVRGRLDVSQTADGQQVPFYLMPALGGPNSLRGYLDYQFRDRDALLLNAEYRWPIFRSLDGAMFYDAGTVAPDAGALSMHRLRTDYGLGLRVHAKNQALFRFDVARGREGMHAIVSFTPPLAFSKRIVMPYVP